MNIPPKKLPMTGTMIKMISDPSIALLARNAGFDMLMMDAEHGCYDWAAISNICLAARLAGVRPFVRVPELSKAHVSRVLDCGALGVMVPMIETAAQAMDLVRWSKFAPVGNRGLSSLGGHTDYEKISDTTSFLSSSNDEIMAIAQIESIAGVENIEEIAAVDGIDSLLVGPNDLALSLGHPGQLDCPKQDTAIERVVAAADKHGKIFGMHAGAAILKKWVPHGMGVIMSSIDIDMLLGALKSVRMDIDGLMKQK